MAAFHRDDGLYMAGSRRLHSKHRINHTGSPFKADTMSSHAAVSKNVCGGSTAREDGERRASIVLPHHVDHPAKSAAWGDGIQLLHVSRAVLTRTLTAVIGALASAIKIGSYLSA